jgi:hypothetical protein
MVHQTHLYKTSPALVICRAWQDSPAIQRTSWRSERWRRDDRTGNPAPADQVTPGKGWLMGFNGINSNTLGWLMGFNLPEGKGGFLQNLQTDHKIL